MTLRNGRSIKRKVSDFRREFRIYTVSSELLTRAMELQGYTVIEFNSICNDEDVSTLVTSLGLSDMIRRSNGFTYSSSKYRLVFINESLSDKEKAMVLAHEEGHIYCDHFDASPIVGSDVRNEYEANEFAHFLLNPGPAAKLSAFMRKNKVIAAVSAAAIFLSVSAAVVFAMAQIEKQYYGDYYITESGSKYHEKECIFVKNKSNVKRLTQEEFESGEYEPCAVCLP